MTVALLYHLVGSSGRMSPDGSSLCRCGLHTNAEIRKKMSLGNPVGSSNLQAADTAGFNDLISRLCTDGKNLTHLIDVQHVGVIFQHELIRFTLGDVCCMVVSQVLPPVFVVRRFSAALRFSSRSMFRRAR